MREKNQEQRGQAEMQVLGQEIRRVAGENVIVVRESLALYSKTSHRDTVSVTRRPRFPLCVRTEDGFPPLSFREPRWNRRVCFWHRETVLLADRENLSIEHSYLYDVQSPWREKITLEWETASRKISWKSKLFPKLLPDLDEAR